MADFDNPVTQFQQGYANQIANEKAKREMQDFLNQREALTGAGSEPVLGMTDIVRPDYLKRLYRTNPEAAIELEMKLFGPEVAARKAGEVETAKLKARNEADLAAEKAEMELYGGGPAAAAPAASGVAVPTATPVPSRGFAGLPVGMKRTVKRGPQGREVSTEFDPLRAEELALKGGEAGRAEEKLGLETGADTRAQRKAITDEIAATRQAYDNGSISLAEKNATIEGLRQQLPGGPRQRAGAVAPAGAAVAPADTFVPKTAEQKEIEKENRANKEANAKEERVRYDDTYKELNSGLTAKKSLATSKLDDLIVKNNTGEFGSPILGLPYLEEAVGFTSDEINQFRQGWQAQVQSFIQPGTSGAVNTIAEQQALARGLGGANATPEGNALTLLALKNSDIRSKEQPGFFREMQRRGLTVNEARDKWDQYVSESSPFVLRDKYKVEPSGQPRAMLWLKQQGKQSVKAAPKSEPKAAAPQKKTRVIGGKTFVEASPGDWVEQ